MSYDIWGNPLRSGHCEVHPHVHEVYPCSMCLAEQQRHNQQQEYDKVAELEHYLNQAAEEIYRLSAESRRLKAALLEIIDETDGIDCDGCFVRNEIARDALGAGTQHPSAASDRRHE